MSYTWLATAVVLALWLLLLKPGTSGVAGMCDLGDSNYTATVVINETMIGYVKKTMRVGTETCLFLGFICKKKYRTVEDWVPVTKYKHGKIIMTKCCPGYSKNNSTSPCELSGCLNKTYGENCTMTCTCPENAFKNCDQDTGECKCLPGWYGTNCTEECKPGYYGSNCQSTCQCENNSTCDTRTGQCNCTAGWQGQFCDTACPNKTYGIMCNKNCTCNRKTICNHVTGDCDTCSPGWQPTQCEKECSKWTYGPGCALNCSCDQDHTYDCWREAGTCLCKPGYEGDNCESECKFDKFGDNCTEPCPAYCKFGTCNHINGSCYTCYGTSGINCTEDCPTGRYGFDCLSKCPCNVSNSNGSCDPCSGACVCVPGWTGPKCDTECPASMVDHGCQSLELHNVCDPRNISWTCAAGWTGDLCTEVCEPGRYGRNCSSNCSCNENQTCSPVTGNCTCKPGYTGELCDEVCEPGLFGLNCSSDCYCYDNQTCSPVTGECACQPGYTGETCDEDCPEGTFGLNCSQNCTCDKGVSCHHNNGSCACDRGWDGDLCIKGPIPVQERKDEGSVLQKHKIYLVAGSGAFLALVCVVGIAVCLWRRKQGAPGNKAPSKTDAEIEMQAGQENRTYGIPKGEPPAEHMEKAKRANVYTDTVNNTQACTNGDAKDHTPEAVVHVDENSPDLETNGIADSLVEEEEYYADVDGEINAPRKPIASPRSTDKAVEEEEYYADVDGDIFSATKSLLMANKDIDDEEYYADVDNEPASLAAPVKGEMTSRKNHVESYEDYDTCDNCVGGGFAKVQEADESYNRLEDFRAQRQEEDYDVIPKDGIVAKRNVPLEDYSTFESVRNMSKDIDNINESGDNRVSDSYDNLDYRNEKDRGLSFDTSMYNVGNEFSAIKDEASFQANGTELKKGNDLTIENEEKRLSERIYEDCLDEVTEDTKQADTETKGENQMELHESVPNESDQGVSKDLTAKTSPPDITQMESHETVDLLPKPNENDTLESPKLERTSETKQKSSAEKAETMNSNEQKSSKRNTPEPRKREQTPDTKQKSSAKKTPTPNSKEEKSNENSIPEPRKRGTTPETKQKSSVKKAQTLDSKKGTPSEKCIPEPPKRGATPETKQKSSAKKAQTMDSKARRVVDYEEFEIKFKK